MLSKNQQEVMDKKILLTCYTFLLADGKITDSELADLVDLPRATVGRYLTGKRLRELIGIDNYAYIKKCRINNKAYGRKKGGQNHG